jgi:hypothetical protein
LSLRPESFILSRRQDDNTACQSPHFSSTCAKLFHNSASRKLSPGFCNSVLAAATATGYGLQGPGSIPSRAKKLLRIFSTASRPALGGFQPTSGRRQSMRHTEQPL